MPFRPMDVIVPTKLETQLTGFIGAAERQLYGKTWRIEWHDGQEARILREGIQVTVKDIPAGCIKSVRNLLLDSHSFFTRASEMSCK